MSELPLDDGPDISAAAHEAARGHVVYLTEHGERLAAIVPAEFAAALEGMTPDQARELLEDLADGAAAREALEEPGEDELIGVLAGGAPGARTLNQRIKSPLLYR
jgi:antitoxin (DNA-binding transcriptional repressor) of toxin-antitoxin stability system